MSVLKVGETVRWRGSWGNDAPKDAKVSSIQVDCVNKEGTEVQKVNWALVNSRSVIVDLDNGHWAYGTQISKK